ncbi:mechanosensitive ion channel [Flavobacterium supellecticarium]|uniref:Mechanosensitive ion channel n=1 Tax=Flavobacterium supellecticarium TaxID=2565924 RepID=A0A4V6RWW5_9FLAO|nr:MULTISPECIES: mechanosensitive ion channel domain-containing protein [Flavobacterium]THF53226.1 mechanosensitive ion channel [Flavobacterium supellecticarium]
MISNEYTAQIISSIIALLFFAIVRYLATKIVKRFTLLSHTMERRSNLVIKYISILIGALSVLSLTVIWGVKADDILLVISSMFAVIGVAMFAQWSILSNVTAGIILFFSFPFKIGDIIKIHDKDFPIEAEIEDITTFHALLKTKDGERITYPNNLLLQKAISIITHQSEEKEFMD